VERIAAGTDVEWLRLAIRAFGFLIPARVLVIPTNEELTIARHSCRLLAELRHPIG
jgi:hypothetical protein